MSDQFAKLWEETEKLNAEFYGKRDVPTIISEVKDLFVNYQIFDKSEIPDEAKLYAKLKTMGEILSRLSELSFLDNINVFAGMNMAKENLKIDIALRNERAAILAKNKE